MKGKHMFVPVGGMNSDDSDEHVEPTDFRFSRDLEIGFQANGDSGAAVGTRGLKAAFPEVPGVFEPLGSVEDIKTESAFVFVWAENGEHQVRRIYKDGAQEILIQSASLGFSKELITTADVIDDLLTFTQPGQPPKAFLITKAEKFYQSGGTDPDGYSEFTPDTVLAGALPPWFSPTWKYVRVYDGTAPGLMQTSGEQSHVNDRSFQFSYYYVYDDNTHSAPSPISTLAYPKENVSEHGDILFDYEPRGIEVFFDTGISTVVRIVLMAREGNVGAWVEFKKIDKSAAGYGNQQQESFVFTNTKAGSLYSRKFTNYHYLPITTKYQRYLHGGNLAYANYEAGYGKVDPDIKLTLSGTDKGVGENYDIRFVNKIINRTTIPGGTPYLSEAGCIVGLPSVLGKDGMTLAFDLSWTIKKLGGDDVFVDSQIQFQGPVGGKWSNDFSDRPRKFRVNLEVPNPAPEVSDLSSYVLIIQDQISSQWRAWARNEGRALFGNPALPDGWDYDSPGEPKVYAAADAPGLFDVAGDVFNGYFLVMYFPGLVVPMDSADKYDADAYGPSDDANWSYSGPNYFLQDMEKFAMSKIVKSYKRGSVNKFAINYYDKFNRDNSCVIGEADEQKKFEVVVPEWLYNPINPMPGLESPLTSERFKLFVDAEINHTPPEFATHFQWVVAENVGVSSYGYFRVTEIDLVENWLSLADAEIIEDNVILSTKNDGHSVTEGDYIRTLDDAYDLKSNIKGVVTGVVGNKIYFNDAYQMKDIGAGEVLEIFTQGKDPGENVTYKEFGQEYKILNPHTSDRVHQGQDQDQTDTVPAKFTLESELNYNRDRSFVWKKDEADLGVNDLPIAFYNRVWVEDRRFSDWETIPAGDGGRVAIYDSKSERKRYDNVYHGGKFFKNTPINDLWVMASGDEKTMSASKGEITGLAFVGYTLKVYQQHGVTSIYIGRTAAMNTDGTENVIGLSNEVFGTVNPSSSPYGCQNPESIVSTKRYVYFFDRSMMSWCRDAPNGIVPISAYKMKSEWANISRDAPEDAKFFSAFDENEDMLVVTVPGDDYRPAYVFFESEKRWKGTFSFDVGLMGMIGSDVVGFKANADAYLLWRGSVGENMLKYHPTIRFVVNGDYAIAKILDALSIQTNRAWFVDPIVSPSVSSGTDREMSTRILDTKFERLEDKYHADVPGDMNTPGALGAMGVVNGDEMRGQAFDITMGVGDRDFNVRLAHVVVFFTHSMNTP